MKFEIYQTESTGRFRFRLKAANGEIIAHGQSYSAKRDCEHVILLLQKAGLHVPIADLTKNGSQKP